MRTRLSAIHQAVATLVTTGFACAAFAIPSFTSVSSNANPSNAGSAVTLTASVTGGSPITGTVSFSDSGSTIPGCGAVPLSAAQAQCTTRTLLAGARSIVATYSGDRDYSGSSSAPLTQSVRYVYAVTIDASQETPQNGSAATGSATVTIDVVANQVGYNIVFSGLTSAETDAHFHGFAGRGVPAGVVFGLPAGSPKVGTAAYSESNEANFLAGLSYINIHSANFGGGEIRGQVDLLVSTTLLTSTASTTDKGAMATFTAYVTGSNNPTGTMEFLDNGAPVPGCSAFLVIAARATCTTNQLDAGPHSITARYTSNGNLLPSESAPLTHSVRYVYNVAIEPQQETPPHTTTGYGTARITLDVVAKQLAYDIRFANLSSAETMAHIHGYAPRGTPTGVVFDLGIGNRKTGVWNYPPGDEESIRAGNAYINIHSVNFGGGEIRGQIDNLGSAVARPNDYSRDGRPDLLFRNSGDGSTYVWVMNGLVLDHDMFVAGIDPSWTLVGTGDFDGDGHNDLVWRNSGTGQAYVWYMVDNVFASDAPVFNVDPMWIVEAVADFNRDGHPDFLFRNTVSGVGFVWYYDNTTPQSDQFLYSISTNWIVENVGDFNNDGYPDFFFRNANPGSGLGFVWLWNGSSLGGSYFMFSIEPHWEVVQIADWNRDGFVDLVFRNRDTGLVFVWYTDGTSLQGSDFLFQIDPSWQIVPAHPVPPPS